MVKLFVAFLYMEYTKILVSIFETEEALLLPEKSSVEDLKHSLLNAIK